MSLSKREAARNRGPSPNRRRASAIDGGVTRVSGSATNVSSIPPIPSNVEPELRYALEALRASVQLQQDKGQGDPLDAAVTFRDIDESTGAVIVGTFTGGSSGGTPPGWVDPPTVPTGVSAVGGFGYTIVSWNLPSYSGHSHTKIYVQPYDGTVPDYSETWYRAASPGAIIDVTLDPGEYWVWCRHVNSATPPVQSGVSTPPVVVEVFENVSDVIDREWEDAIGELDRITDAAWIDEIINAAGQVEQGRHLITIDGELSQIEIEIANVNGRVDINGQEIEAVAGRVQFNGQMIGYCEIDGAITGSTTAAACWAEDPSFDPPPDYDPDDPDQSPLPDDPWKRLPLSAAMDSVYITLEDPEGGEDLVASITGWQQVHVDENGVLKAQWGQKVTVGELQGGIGIVGDYNPDTGTGSIDFVCVANKFTVYDPGAGIGTPRPVFRVSGNAVYMENAFIETAHIDTIVAAGITAERINALDINAVTITGGTISIGAGFDVNEQGVMTATGANITGTMQSTNFAPGVSGWQITNAGVAEFQNGTFRGTIYADEIIGDLVSARAYPNNVSALPSNNAWTTIATLQVANNTGSAASVAVVTPTFSWNFVQTSGLAAYDATMEVAVLKDGITTIDNTTHAIYLVATLGGAVGHATTISLGSVIDTLALGDTATHTYVVRARYNVRTADNGTHSCRCTTSHSAGQLFRDGGAWS